MSINRRKFVLCAAGLGAAVVGGGLLARPGAHGQPYDAYFSALNEELKKNGPMRPCMLIDLDRMDHNIDLVKASVQAPKHYRIVEKSLPSAKLLDYISKRAGTKRFMSFHQPFLNDDAVNFPDSDLLVGKPLPARSAALFYQAHKGSFDPARQLMWLSDTPAHAAQYLEVAKGLGVKMRLNIELDVGLHRGGVPDNDALKGILELIAANPQNLEFAGFMGYDPHAGMGVPSLLGTHEELFRKGMAIYQARVDFTKGQFPQLWRNGEGLTLNAAGSPTYKLHEGESLSNDISVGTAILKPTHYDLDTLQAHVPAAYIATPVLKAAGPLELPALDDKSRILSWWDPNLRETYFIYGGYWMAEYESPKGLQFNATFGHSTNQEIVNASAGVGLKVDDQVFFRPTQSEFVLLQFGDIVAVRGGKIVDYWPPLSDSGPDPARA